MLTCEELQDVSRLEHLFHIRQARPNDAEAIRSVYTDSWIDANADPERGLSKPHLRYHVEGTDYQRTRKRVKEIRQRIANYHFHPELGQDYVAILDNDVVGYTSARIRKDGERLVGALFVHPTVQGLGIGRRLLETNLAWHGPDSIVHLNVASRNHRARKFYEHHGFAPTGKTRVRYIDGIAIPQIELVRQGVTL